MVKGPVCGRDLGRLLSDVLGPGFWPVVEGPVCGHAKGTLSISTAQSDAILWNDDVIGSVKL